MAGGYVWADGVPRDDELLLAVLRFGGRTTDVARMAARPKIGELLLAAGAIDQVQLGAALAEQRNFGRPLGTILVQMGSLDEETLLRTLARQLKLPVAWLRGKWVERDVLELVSAELALKHRVLPLSVTLEDTGKMLYLAIQDPSDLEALDAIRFQVGHNVSPVLAAASELDDALQRHYESGSVDGGGGDGAVPEVQNVPELLSFEQRAPSASEEIELDDTLGVGPVAPARAPSKTAHASSEAALAALLQLIETFLDSGIVTQEDLAKRLRPYLGR